MISTVTGEELVTFENWDCFKLTGFSPIKLEAIKDKRLRNQEQRLSLIERAKILKEKTGKIFLSVYNDFLVSRPKNQKGFLKKAQISILRFQRSAYYVAKAGGQSLRD